ncbi:DUF6479 family protein [Streptomyces sp. NPDC005132]|uniref:DUF6479 family protein n=1 Tax=Streptomyces sp. NPDC005132 TaxID=3154294 RepID=UPI0033B299E1
MPSHFLAADGSSSLFLIAAGVVLVILLVSAFWYGSRRSSRGKDSGRRAVAQNPPATARRDSWKTPDEADEQSPR